MINTLSDIARQTGLQLDQVHDHVVKLLQWYPDATVIEFRDLEDFYGMRLTEQAARAVTIAALGQPAPAYADTVPTIALAYEISGQVFVRIFDLDRLAQGLEVWPVETMSNLPLAGLPELLTPAGNSLLAGRGWQVHPSAELDTRLILGWSRHEQAIGSSAYTAPVVQLLEACDCPPDAEEGAA